MDLDEGYVAARQRHVRQIALSAKPLPVHMRGDDGLTRQQCNVVLETLIGATEKRFEFHLKGVDGLIGAADASKDAVMDALDAFVLSEVAGASSGHGVTGLGRSHARPPGPDAAPEGVAGVGVVGGAVVVAPGQIRAAVDVINQDMAERGEVIKVRPV